MVTQSSPMGRMKEQHKAKETLVDRLMGVLEAGDTPKDDLKARLLAVSNKKLLRLLDVATKIKEQYGSSQKLAEAVASALDRAKDQAFVVRLTKLARRSPARVLDMVQTAVRRRGKGA